MAEGYDLRFEFGPRSEAGPKCRKEGRDAWAHDWCTVSAETGKLNRHKVYGLSDRDKKCDQRVTEFDAVVHRMIFNL